MLFFSYLRGGRHSRKAEDACALQNHFLAPSMSWCCCWVTGWNSCDSASERVTHFVTIILSNIVQHILSSAQKNTVIPCCGFGIVPVPTERDRVLCSRMEREGKLKTGGKERWARQASEDSTAEMPLRSVTNWEIFRRRGEYGCGWFASCIASEM